jgi:DAK2 domain fusion protein YloV
VEKAYSSVVKPVEGTILTVARLTAAAAQHSVKKNKDLVALLTDMVKAAKVAQANTPEMLPILKEAGVTDAGGQGLVYILEGGLRFMNNEPVGAAPAGEAAPRLQSTLGADEKAYGYDVQFLVQGSALNVEDIRAYVDTLGWSTVVVGDERIVKVHVHTNDPGLPLSYGASLGVISDVVVENMEVQAKEFVHKHFADSPSRRLLSAARETGDTVTICVAPGNGLARIFQSLGVSQVLRGGQTNNPSTKEFLEAINQTKADNVLILPNNSNVILAANQAETLSEKRVKVVPTKTVPQGIAAALSFNYHVDFEMNAQRMFEAAQQVQTIEVTRSIRNCTCNGFNVKPGNVMGFFDNELMVVGKNYHTVVLDLLTQTDTGPHEVITVYFGQDSSQEQADFLADKIRALYPEMEVEVHNGGQPYYYYIISLE